MKVDARAGSLVHYLVLPGFVVLCLGIGAVGGAITATSVGTWYQDLAKPFFNPPDSVFAPVWTTLYVVMAVAAWLVWRTAGWRRARTPMLLFGLQLLLNIGWSALFFGLRRVDLALVEIVVLWFSIAATLVVFWRISRLAGALLIPYLVWVSFAIALNAGIWRLNPV